MAYAAFMPQTDKALLVRAVVAFGCQRGDKYVLRYDAALRRDNGVRQRASHAHRPEGARRALAVVRCCHERVPGTRVDAVRVARVTLRRRGKHRRCANQPGGVAAARFYATRRLIMLSRVAKSAKNV